MSLTCLACLLLQLLVAAGKFSEGERGVPVCNRLHDCIMDEGVLLLGKEREREGGTKGGKERRNG